MAEMAEGQGAPEKAVESPQSPDRTVGVQNTITVIKSSEAEKMKSLKNGDIEGSSEGDIHGHGRDETDGEKSEPTHAEPEIKEEQKDTKSAMKEEHTDTEPEIRTEHSDTESGVTEESKGTKPKIKEDVQNVSDSESESESGRVRRRVISKFERKYPLPEPLTEEEIDSVIQKYARLSTRNLQKCLDFFWSVDTKRHGYFTLTEFAKVMRTKRRNITDEEITDIFTDIDLDCDFVVSLWEFLLDMSRKKWKDLSKEDLKPVFDDIDKNQDGFICENDYEAWFLQTTPQGVHNDPFIDALLHEIQLRPDRRVDLDRFVRIIRRTSQR